jgi:hypothetical protein
MFRPQCPVPKDRIHAFYSGACRGIGGCCFNELVNNVSSSCCYQYGTNGPIKCCGWDNSISQVGIFFIVVAAFIIYLLIMILVGRRIIRPNDREKTMSLIETRF